MNFTTKPSDHPKKKKKPSNRTLEMKRKFKTKPNGKISQEKISNYRKRDRIEIAGNSENFFQRRMNQKASKHSRLFEQRERERERNDAFGLLPS